MSEIRNLSTANNLLDVLSDITGNKFVTFSYLKLYKLQTKRTRGINVYNPEQLKADLDKFAEKYGNTETYKGLKRFYDDKTLKEFPYTVINVLRYNTQWTSQKDFNEKYTNFRQQEDIIRPKYGLPVRGHKESGLEVLDYGQTGITVGNTENTQDNLYLRMNMFNAKLLDNVLYLLDEKGNVIEEVPTELINTLKYIESDSDANAITKKNLPENPTQEDIDRVSQMVIDYYDDINELKFKPKNYRVDRVLFITATANEQKYFFANDKLTTAIDKKVVNPSSFRPYIDNYIEKNFKIEK